MNVKRFLAKSSREALTQVRETFGDDAVVLSTRPAPEGVEVLAMAAEGMKQIEKMAAPRVAARAAAKAEAAAAASSVGDDVEQLSMSTLSFQDYVRERMLKRRAAEMKKEAPPAPVPARASAPAPESLIERARARGQAAAAPAMPSLAEAVAAPSVQRDPPVLRESVITTAPMLADSTPQVRDQALLDELRSMKGLIEDRFSALAFIEKLQRQPGQARLLQRLLDCGFSPALIKKLADALPQDVTDETGWAAGVLERNLSTDENEVPLEDQGGVYALVGSTGVGKTTSTAKIAAAFATKHGAANLGLITLDAYRIAAHEQLRAYGRILGVPVHTAHDRASLDDLLELLAGKKMVLIDTAGMAQRDSRTRELLDMLAHRSVKKLLVVNAASQGETIEDVIVAYRGAQASGIVLSKVDEAVKLGPAVDALIRHKLKVVGVANGQRVPEDWHRLSAHALVQRALRANPNASWRLDDRDVSLVFAGAAYHTHSEAVQ